MPYFFFSIFIHIQKNIYFSSDYHMNVSTCLLFGQTASEQTYSDNKVSLLTAPDQRPCPLF